jgi:tetratricopeptide (TPR) repeat protein
VEFGLPQKKISGFMGNATPIAVKIGMPLNKFFIALFLLPGFAAHIGFAAQDESKKPDYSRESCIVTRTETRLRFAADGTSERTQTTSIKMLSEAGVRTWGVLAFVYASENERVDVHFVRVRKADGSTVATPPENVLDLPSEVTREAPLYSDLKQKQIPVKALGVGDMLEFEVAYVEDKPLVPGQFWYSYNFTRNFVVLKEVLELRVPQDKQPRISNADLKPVMTEDGPERVYTWTTSNTEPSKPSGMVGDTEKPEKASVQISTFTSWQQVGEWYGKLARPQAKVTPEIQAKADALVKDIPPGPARIQAIYDFVSSHIRYISLSFGIGRYEPHTAAQVLENEYGDCKDKHTLLAALLKAEGIEAWPALIPSSVKLDEDVPSPGQFDHVITVVPLGKQYLWLDTTPEVAPYGLLMIVLRDKQALVIPDSAASFLMKTPADPPFPSEDHLVMRGDLDNEGTFKGHGALTMRGDNEVVYRMVFHASARAKWQDVLQAISYRLGFGGEVSNVQIDDPDATRQPFHLTWDYERKKFGDWDNRQIVCPTGGIPINYINEQKEPKSPIQVGPPGSNIFTGELTLPPGATMEAPKNVDIKTGFAEYHAEYSVINGRFLSERRLTILNKEVPAADWQKYVAFQRELNEDYNRMSTVTTPGAQPPAGIAENNPEAASLIEGAFQDFQNHAVDAAEDKLDKAKKLAPHQTNLNSAYGSLYMMQGKMEEGLDAIRTELKEHPDNLRIARWFAQMLVRMKRDDEAIGVYQTVLKNAPDDVDATSELTRLLVEKERWKEAQPVVERAIQLRPDNVQVQVWYGQSCLRNGKEAEGLAALTKAADGTADPAMLSSVAASLAEAGKNLDVAEHAAQRAVTLIEEQTKDLSLQEITNPQMKKMTDLALVWDRMSWVAFKADDLAVAERYAFAAWTLSEEPSAGDHLGQMYEKQGKLAQALDTYLLAQARGYPVVAGLGDRVNSLRKRLGSKGVASGSGRMQESTNDRLQNMRMIKFPRTRPVSASADFLVLFAGGKVSDVKMLGGDPRLEPYGDTLRQTRFNFSFPDEGPEHVVRQGILSCSVYDPECMFLMMLPADARAYSLSGTPIHAGETKVIHLPHD